MDKVAIFSLFDALWTCIHSNSVGILNDKLMTSGVVMHVCIDLCQYKCKGGLRVNISWIFYISVLFLSIPVKCKS